MKDLFCLWIMVNHHSSSLCNSCIFHFILLVGFMIFKQIVLFLLLLFVIFFAVWIVYELVLFMFTKPTSAMYVPSFDRHIKLMQNHLHLIRWKKLVDLWCGDGKAMRFFAKEFGLQCDGYELQFYPYRYGKLINWILWYPHVHLYRKDFSQANIKHYDYIYVYLLPQQMAEIEPWIFQHMNAHTIIISNSFQFKIHQPYEVIKDAKGKPSIFLYKK